MLGESLEEQLAAAAAQSGSASALPIMREAARECLYFTETETKKVGVSRVGGKPDLPRSVEWPGGLDESGEPFGYATFLAQLDLSEVPPLPDLPLPRKGMLWLFARARGMVKFKSRRSTTSSGGLELEAKRRWSSKT